MGHAAGAAGSETGRLTSLFVRQLLGRRYDPHYNRGEPDDVRCRYHGLRGSALLHDHLEPKSAREQDRRISRRASAMLGAASGVVLVLLLCLTLAACSVGRAPVPAPSPTTGPTAAPTIGTIATPSGPITITYWETDTDDADVLLDELAAEFMKANPAITVKRAHYSYDDLRNEFRAKSFNGQPPELVRAPGEFAGPFSELKIVRPLDEIFSKDSLDQYFTGALAGATTQGKLWGLPDNYGNHLMLLYNKALVTDVPSNTDAWIAQLKTLTDPATPQYGLAYPLDESYWLIPWLAGFGGWPMDATDRPALDTVEMANALQFLYDLKATHHVVPEKADYDAAFDYFRQGKAAYIIDGTWNLDRYTDLGIDVGVAPLPVVERDGLEAGLDGNRPLLAHQRQGRGRRARCCGPIRRVHDLSGRTGSMAGEDEASAQRQRSRAE